jgi:hypothetical protein
VPVATPRPLPPLTPTLSPCTCSARGEGEVAHPHTYDGSNPTVFRRRDVHRDASDTSPPHLPSPPMLALRDGRNQRSEDFNNAATLVDPHIPGCPVIFGCIDAMTHTIAYHQGCPISARNCCSNNVHLSWIDAEDLLVDKGTICDTGRIDVHTRRYSHHQSANTPGDGIHIS